MQKTIKLYNSNDEVVHTAVAKGENYKRYSMRAAVEQKQMTELLIQLKDKGAVVGKIHNADGTAFGHFTLVGDRSSFHFPKNYK